MNWDNIRILVAVNRLGSVAKAADYLGMNASTVLRRLAMLETDLNLKLFNRLPAGYEITPAGEELLEYAVAMESHALELQRKASGSTAETSGKLQIALPPSGSLDIIPLLAQFRKEYPQIELNLDFEMNTRDLNKMEAEVALRFTNNPPEDYVGYRLLQLTNSLYASKNYLKTHAPIQSLADIQDWLVIQIPNLSDQLEDWIHIQSPNASITMRTNSMQMAAQAISFDMGVSFLSAHTAEQFDQLQKLPLPEVESDITLWILTHQDLRFQPRVKAFIDFVRVHLPLRYSGYAQLS